MRQPLRQGVQPRGRRLAESEKEKAQRALRALVADPATDFAAMAADEFSAALKLACGEGLVNGSLAADAERRVGAGIAPSRDLHQILCVAGRNGAWDAAKAAAIAAVAWQGHLAVEIVGMEAQRRGSPGMRVTESMSDEGFTAQAALAVDGTGVEGQPCADNSKKRVRQAAAASLLATLTGLDLPMLAVACPEAATALPTAATSALGVGCPLPGTRMTAAELEAWLDYEVSQPEPDPGYAAEITAGKLSARSVYLLLCEADPRGWAPHRATAWQVLTASPPCAPGVLSMLAQARSWPPASYAEPGAHTAVAYVVTPEGPVVGDPAAAASPKAARAAAALSLIQDLVPPAGEHPARPGPPPEPESERNPVSDLNERAQTGAITGLTFAQSAEGPAHRPVFTCTATCTAPAGVLTGTGEGRSKNEAKAAAAAVLLGHLDSAERPVAPVSPPTHGDPARTRAGIFERLLRAGCAVGFDAEANEFWLSAAGGSDLPGPLTDWDLPLLAALPVLAATAGLPCGSGTIAAATSLDASALAWSSAATTALKAVAARRVYPALDAEGRDAWRLLPDPSDPVTDEIAEFFDAAADDLLRPPGARLILGDVPYAGRPRELAAADAEWADDVAGAAEGTESPPLVLRISRPDTDTETGNAVLRAEIRVRGAEAKARLGHAGHRLLRRAITQWPPLESVRRDAALAGADAAALLGPVGDRLAALGITAEWPEDLVIASGFGAGERGGLGVGAVVRSDSGTGVFAQADAVALEWRLTMDGEPLTEEETTAVADAVAGVFRLRGRWVVIDAKTARKARDRVAGTLTGAQALTAALTGRVVIGGQEVACSAAGRLADLAGTLRGSGRPGGGDHDVQAGDVPVPAAVRADLRGYQRRALTWLARITELGFGALLADDMGLGKTLTVIAFHALRRERAEGTAAGARPAGAPSLVVCPASLLANWEREFARFAPGVTVRRYHGTGRSLDGLAPGEVVVTTYGTMVRDTGALVGAGWDLVVADEAQQVKNHRSQAARALRRIPAAARVAVTGTPVENSLTELWAILDWTNPGLFGTLAAFRDRYGRAAEREAAGDAEARTAPSGAAARLSRLVSPFVMRRRKTDPDVAPELPDKAVSVRYVQLTREQAALYAEASAQTLARIAAAAGIERRGQVLRLLQTLRQICNTPAHFLREPAEDWDASVQAARSGKLEALDELMESIVVSGDAALIFTGYVSMGRLLQAHLAARGARAEFLHGGVPIARRQEIVDQFQSGDGDALILSVRAAGTGLNLTRAGHVIHFDRPWNPAVEDQATDRAHRIGQHRLVEVHHLIAEGTVEDRIADLLARKRGLTQAVLEGGETALTELSGSELRALVSLGSGGDATGGGAE